MLWRMLLYLHTSFQKAFVLTYFKQMKKSRNHFVVLDEYGGVLGIVTMNDLLEQLVGDLDDEIR